MKTLVVDDEFVSLTRMVAFFSRYGECEAATHGKQAVEMYCDAFSKGKPYDMVTLDIDMPALNGLETLQMIDEKEGLKGIPRAKKLIVTANSSRSNVATALKYHCDGFLVKPISNDALIAALQKAGVTLPESSPASA